MTGLALIVYPPELIGPDGYPYAWHGRSARDAPEDEPRYKPIKDYVRELAGHRCERCGHPYPPGIAEKHPRGEWTPCDDLCTHLGPIKGRWMEGVYPEGGLAHGEAPEPVLAKFAHWRILTVHHLNGNKADCRWWNLAALCQRCHLTIQGRVVMERAFIVEHSAWMKPHAAGWYAVKYEGKDISREEAARRQDELLAHELLLATADAER